MPGPLDTERFTRNRDQQVESRELSEGEVSSVLKTLEGRGYEIHEPAGEAAVTVGDRREEELNRIGKGGDMVGFVRRTTVQEQTAFGTKTSRDYYTITTISPEVIGVIDSLRRREEEGRAASTR